MSNSIAMEVECCDFDEDIMPKKNINELPDEVLEYIFSLVSPYRDLKECMLVCKRWLETVKNVSRLLTLKLTNAINSMDVAWQAITPVEMAPTITKRYSHSACYHENSMYVFGGCTSTSTTFNDLWRLDLNKRQWVRPLTMGTYPSPKACATMVRYKDALIVFGGWTSPSPYPLHQTWRFFNELHIYCILKNRWMCINTAVSPPGMAGHSATVHGNKMIVFGGLRAEVHGQYSSCNDVWCFNLEKEEWSKQPTTEVKPHNRYGQSQISLGTDYLLILGGCGGPNMVFNDVWLLSMTGDTWEWREVQVQNKEWSAAHMWCHRACRVGNYVVMMSRDPRPLKRKPQNILKNKVKPRPSSVWFPPKYEESMPGIPQRIYPTVQQIDRDSNVNGQRGTFNRPNWNQINSVQGLENDVAIDTASDESGCSHTKRMKNTQPKGCVETDSKPGPSGLSNLSPARANSLDDRQPGPSGVGKEGGSAGVGPNQAKNEVQDGPNANSPYWDRLRPISRPPSGIQLAAFQDQEQAARTCPSRARERQLLALQRVEERMRMNNLVRARAQEPSDGEEVSPAKLQRTMVLCVLDITNVLEEECSVRWLSSSESFSSGPEETLLYSLVVGRGELIMFGGIHREAMTLMTNSHVNPRSTTLSNSLHFISAPFGVI